MIKSSHVKNLQKGFTLIELLIVIVVIGVLAGLVIVILNPTLQRNRARDAVIIASINKIAGEAQSFSNSDITGVGTYPTCLQLTGPAGAGTTTTCPNAATGTLRSVTACPCTAITSAPGALDFSFNIGNIVTGGDGTTTHLGFRYVPNGSAGFCISARAANPPAVTPATPFIRYLYPTDPAPGYNAAGCTG